MSNTFDPGPGWREIEGGGLPHNGAAYVHWAAGPDGPFRDWFREAPVPALPTAPYTVIHVTWLNASPRDYSAGVLMRRPEGDWEYEPGVVYEGDDLHGDISGFKVLSEPRAVTAKAVLDRVMENVRGTQDLSNVAREFGVES